MELIGQRILIVDDEPLFLNTTGQLLSKEGADCETAADADSALMSLERSDFDLILTDLNMPGNLRWELLKAGRQRWSHVPMIVITGVPTLPSAIESLRLGVVDYLLKPVGFPELLASVRRAVAGRASMANQSEAGSAWGTVESSQPGEASSGVDAVMHGAESERSPQSSQLPDHALSLPMDQPTERTSLPERRAEMERAYLLELIKGSHGNVTRAARKANMSRQGFHKLMKRHGLSARDYRD